MARRYIAGKFLTLAPRKSRAEFENVSKNHFSSFVLLVLYTVGMIAIVFNIHPNFIYLTPINLLVSLFIVLYNHPKWNAVSFLFFGLVFSLGLMIEIIGVETGLIFGEYQYGEVLGPKILGTPWMIGVNWLLLVYGCGAALNRFYTKGNIFLKSLIGAIALVSLDFLIEPSAMIYGFWSWGADNAVPYQNYVAWFLISYFFLLLFNIFLKDIKNNAAFTLFNLQFIFFLIIGIKWF